MVVIMSDKFCINCKHFIVKYPDHPELNKCNASVDNFDNFCLTGDYNRLEKKYASSSRKFGPCYRDGKLYEPKPKSESKPWWKFW